MDNTVVRIPKRAFVLENLRTAARILLMAACCGVLWALHYLVVLPAPLPTILAASALALCLLAVVVLCRGWPRDRIATISPDITIPAPLIPRGLDSRATPIAHWWLHATPSLHVEYTTANRSGIIRASWFTTTQWNTLISNLPVNDAPNTAVQMGRVRLCFVLFFALCVGVHCLPHDLTVPGTMHRLELGAHHWPLIRSGQTYRVLSYAFVHLNDLHLWLNGIALAMVATALSQGYSNQSLGTLIVLSAITSGIVGTLIGNYTMASGSSGVVMGAFGFLIGAQRRQDLRLHPLNRVARHGYLYMFLAGELLATLTLRWYGGGIHLVGLATGYLYYIGCEAQRAQHTGRLGSGFQIGVLLLGCWLGGSWVIALYDIKSHPEQLARQLLDFNDPLITPPAAMRLAQSPMATRQDMEALKQQASTHLDHAPSNGMAIARANYWLGNERAALTQMRRYIEIANPSDAARRFWLTLEALSLDGDAPPVANNVLTVGSNAALLVSSNQLYFALVRRKEYDLDLSLHIRQPRGLQWHFIADLPVSGQTREGVWKPDMLRYRTRQSASTAAGK